MATILIVDDRPTNRDFLTKLLGNEDHRLIQAGDGTEGLALARTEHADLVITDILMPTMDGYEFVRQLRAEPAFASTPVIFYTAPFHESAARALAPSCGNCHVLAKPSTPEVLRSLVEAILGAEQPPALPPVAEERNSDQPHPPTGDLYADVLRRVTELERQVSEHKQTQAALVESEARNQAILESAVDAIIPIDRAGLIREFNPAAEKIFGYQRAAAVGREMAELLIPPSLRDRHKSGLARLLATGETTIVGKTVELVGMRADGTEFPVEISITSFRVNGEPMFTGFLRDITARKQAEEALRASEERTRLLLDSTAEAIYGIDTEGRCTFANPASARLLGYAEPGQLLGRHMHSLSHHTRADGTPYPVEDCRIYQAYRLGQGFHVEDEVFWRADGSSFPTEYWSYPIRRGEQIVGSVVTFWDISERKQLEDQFRQAQKMEAIGQLAGGVAHDFNNLLTVINGYGELVLRRLPEDDPTRRLIREVVAAGNRAAGLTRQLLAFSRKTILEPKILDLRVVVADVDNMLRRILGEDIHLTVVADPELGAVKADPGHIEQVILNLVVNARDAMPRGGRLTIEVSNAELDESYTSDHPFARPGPYVLVAVSDTGCGMDPATMARVFEPFFTTKGEKGTGLGLATVYGIVKQSGGHVAVYSEVGQGTTFKVYLPRVEGRPSSGKSHHGLTELPRGSETILLVEDEDGVRALARHVLQSCGYAVVEARDGAEAVQVAEQHQGRIDLLVTDVILPRTGGREVAERLTALHREAKVLFLSGYTDDAVVRHGILEAEVAFLQKPFSPASLAVKVREVLESR